MKLLIFDLETSPSLGYVWSMWKQNLYPDQIVQYGETISWAAKWLDGKKIFCDSVNKTSSDHMIQGIWDLMDQADAICHFNGSKFDIPTINREFVQTNRPPPSPSKEIDLYRVVKQNFKFPRNSLQSVCEFLGLDLKTDHKGFLLWKECLEGNQTAWNTMHRYNKQDVKITEQLYKRLLPWIRNHPNLSLYLDSSRPACPNCGGTEMEKRGLARTNTQQYQRYQCKGCGKWSRERFNCTPPEKKHTVLQGIHN